MIPIEENDRRWANEKGYRKYLDTCIRIGQRGGCYHDQKLCASKDAESHCL